MDFQSAKKEVNTTGEELHQLEEFVLQEYDFLRNLNNLLAEAKIRHPPERSLRNQSKRLILRAGNVQRRAYNNVEDVVKRLHSIQDILPSLQERLTKLSRDLHLYAAKVLTYTSKRTGELMVAVKEPPIQPDHLAAITQEVIREGIEPLLAVIRSARQLFEEQKQMMEEDLTRHFTFQLDISSLLRVRGVHAEHVIIIMDTDFARSMAKEKVRRHLQGYTLNIPLGKLIVPLSVYQEMETRGGITREPTVPAQLRNYLLSQLHASVESVQATPAEEKEVMEAWRSTTKSAQSLTEWGIKKFKESGDFSILVLVIRENPLPVIVLSNDSEVSQSVRALQRRGIVGNNVRVYSFSRGALSLAA